jgi:hypothetical protein
MLHFSFRLNPLFIIKMAFPAWVFSKTFKHIFLSTVFGTLLGMLIFRPKNGALVGLGFGLGYTYTDTKAKIKAQLMPS